MDALFVSGDGDWDVAPDSTAPHVAGASPHDIVTPTGYEAADALLRRAMSSD